MVLCRAASSKSTLAYPSLLGTITGTGRAGTKAAVSASGGRDGTSGMDKTGTSSESPPACSPSGAGEPRGNADVKGRDEAVNTLPVSAAEEPA